MKYIQFSEGGLFCKHLGGVSGQGSPTLGVMRRLFSQCPIRTEVCREARVRATDDEGIGSLTIMCTLYTSADLMGMRNGPTFGLTIRL